jgi:hypothetical protein
VAVGWLAIAGAARVVLLAADEGERGERHDERSAGTTLGLHERQSYSRLKNDGFATSSFSLPERTLRVH